MLFDNWSESFTRWLHFSLLMTLMVILHSGCKTTYSIDEQYNLAATRSAQMSNQLEFSFRWTAERVSFGQDIFFVATFTDTTSHSIVFRKPMQQGVMEVLDPDTTLLFVVEPISVTDSFTYPGKLSPGALRTWTPIQPDEFVTLPPHGKFETRLKLPRLVFRKGIPGDLVSLPPGQYLVRMTYDNPHVGYRVERGEWRYVDMGAWVGRVESNPVLLTITP